MTGDVITRLERRVDDVVTLMREEMAATRREMLQAIAGCTSGSSPLFTPVCPPPRSFGLEAFSCAERGTTKRGLGELIGPERESARWYLPNHLKECELCCTLLR